MLAVHGLKVHGDVNATLWTLRTAGEVSRAVTEQMFTTLDFTAPRFLPGYPHISAIEDTHATVAVMQDEPGQVYYLVQGPSQPLPSSHQVQRIQQVALLGTLEFPHAHLQIC